MKFGSRIGRMAAALGIVTALMAASAASVASAVEISGVKLDETASVGNQELKLNGAGIRYKFIIKVYVAGLYLPEKKNTLADIMALPGAKRVTLVMLRDLDTDTLGEAFMEGIRKNNDIAERTKIINQMTAFGHLFATVPELKKGDVLAVDWLPGMGTQCQLNGKKIGDLIPDVAFYNALLKLWLGPNPADSKLKPAMLGEKS